MRKLETNDTEIAFNPRTYEGGGGGYHPPPRKVFLSFFFPRG